MARDYISESGQLSATQAEERNVDRERRDHAKLIEQAQREARINECDVMLGRLRADKYEAGAKMESWGLERAVIIVEARQQQLIREREVYNDN